MSASTCKELLEVIYFGVRPAYENLSVFYGKINAFNASDIGLSDLKEMAKSRGILSGRIPEKYGDLTKTLCNVFAGCVKLRGEIDKVMGYETMRPMLSTENFIRESQSTNADTLLASYKKDNAAVLKKLNELIRSVANASTKALEDVDLDLFNNLLHTEAYDILTRHAIASTHSDFKLDNMRKLCVYKSLPSKSTNIDDWVGSYSQFMKNIEEPDLWSTGSVIKYRKHMPNPWVKFPTFDPAHFSFDAPSKLYSKPIMNTSVSSVINWSKNACLDYKTATGRNLTIVFLECIDDGLIYDMSSILNMKPRKDIILDEDMIKSHRLLKSSAETCPCYVSPIDCTVHIINGTQEMSIPRTISDIAVLRVWQDSLVCMGVYDESKLWHLKGLIHNDDNYVENVRNQCLNANVEQPIRTRQKIFENFQRDLRANIEPLSMISLLQTLKDKMPDISSQDSLTLMDARQLIVSSVSDGLSSAYAHFIRKRYRSVWAGSDNKKVIKGEFLLSVNSRIDNYMQRMHKGILDEASKAIDMSGLIHIKNIKNAYHNVYMSCAKLMVERDRLEIEETDNFLRDKIFFHMSMF